MPAFMDRRKEETLLDSLRAISRILGKEQDYQAFIEWVTFAEESGARPSLEEIAAHTPTWIQLLSPPLRKLYDVGYDNGHADASKAWRSLTRSRPGGSP